MSTAIVCCAKLEEPYIVEWINYNFNVLGFDAIYIYDNNETPEPLSTILSTSFDQPTLSRIFIAHVPDNYLLFFRATQHWIQNEISKYKAVAFIDPDEFIVLHKHKNIKELLEETLYPRGGSLGINWIFFGNNGLTEPDPRPVTERFTMRQATPSDHVKSIVVCVDLVRMVNPHFPELKNGTEQRDASGNLFEKHSNPKGTTDIVQLNHYWCKTYPEWLVRRNKGHIDQPDRDWRRPLELYETMNFNEVFDDRAWQAYKQVL